MNYNLGKLEKITNLREVWKNEATDFTKWLAKENNIKLLSEELGFNITVDETEASTGRYNVDIKAHEEETDKTIIIENQLEMTNHDHLGKVIVYSAGFDADIQIWIVKDVRDEHKQAVDWLNEHSDEHINIFLVQIELWKIGDSLIAPFRAVPGLGLNVAKQIVAAREERPFLSKEDLAERGKVSQTLIDFLTDNHVLDKLPDENQLSLF